MLSGLAGQADKAKLAGFEDFLLLPLYPLIQINSTRGD